MLAKFWEKDNMKKLGIIGGMSWESTITYYQKINEIIGEILGGTNSADILIRSLNLKTIEEHQDRGEWNDVANILCSAAEDLEQTGVDFILMASNTVHKVYDKVKDAVDIPVLHIAEPTVEAIKKAGFSTIGLLGTRHTMEGDFRKEKLNAAGIQVVVPRKEQFDVIHKSIFEEACLGKVCPETKKMFIDIIEDLKSRCAEGVILGCTELGLLIKNEDSCLPLFDTALLHAQKAAEEIMK